MSKNAWKLGVLIGDMAPNKWWVRHTGEDGLHRWWHPSTGWVMHPHQITQPTFQTRGEAYHSLETEATDPTLPPPSPTPDAREGVARKLATELEAARWIIAKYEENRVPSDSEWGEENPGPSRMERIDAALNEWKTLNP